MHAVRRLTAGAATLTVAAVLAACAPQGPTPEEQAASEADERRFAGCEQLVGDITETLQGYVDQFAPDDGSEDAVDGGLGGEVPSTEDLQAAAEQFARRRAALGCQPREFQVLLERALDDLRGRGPMARAVAAQVRDEVLPVVGPVASVTVNTDDDLIEAVHAAGPGALVQLEAGEHVLDEPLVLLRETRLVGAGSERTTVVSRAEGAVVLQAGAGPLVLEGITLAHEGTEPASVLVVPSGSYELDDVTLTGGVADDSGSTGWGLVLGGGMDLGGEDVVQRAAGLEASENGAGGVVVTGDRAPSLRGVTVVGNDGCGVCWFGTAGGELRNAEVRDNGIGLTLAGEVAPVVRGVTVTGSADLGVLFEADAAGRLLDVEVAGGAIGILVRGNAGPTVTGVTVREVTEAHVVFAGDAGGALTDATCETADLPGLVLLEATTVDADLAGDECEVVDQRDG